MSRSITPKLHASISIAEISQQPSHHQQNWLLTYVDVFVLIVMLLLTLITFSELETNPVAEKKTIQQQHTKKLIRSIPSNTKIEPDLLDFNQKQQLAIKKVITPVFKQNLTTLTKEKQIFEHRKNHHKAENFLQEQLAKTVNEIGLLDSIDIKIEQGYAQLEIHDKILFDSSETNLLESGEILLKKIIPLLKRSTGLIYIEGHTDNRPINTVKFPSNWELGAARSTSVLHFLASQGMQDSRLIAISYGDTKPITDNLTEAGREKNRRVSILIKVSDKID